MLCTLVLSSGWAFAAAPEPAEPTLKPVPMDSATDPDRFANLPRLLWDDAGHVVTAPSRWGRSEWMTAGAGAAAVLGTALVLDHSAEKFVADHASASSDRVAKAVQNLGGAPSVLIAGGTYLAGVALKDPEVRATGIDTMVTMGLAQILVALPLKVAVGRSRPNADKGTHDFHPFNGGQSFPSGHTTQAFALASVISEHADRPWVSGLSYGLAGLVGLARVEQREHFMSDVVAGGLIGTFMGKAVVSFNQSLRTKANAKVAVSFAPAFQPGGYGLSLALKF
jgi:membrane-associated phospholipid phosphatase